MRGQKSPKMLENGKIAVIACDISRSRGEGRLARAFLSTKKISIDDPEIDRFVLPDKWVSNSPRFVPGFLQRIVVLCWLLITVLRCRVRRYDKLYVLNYLSLWNFTIFLFSPKHTTFAPVTGGGPVNKRHLFGPALLRCKHRFFRNVCLPVLYRISEKIIHWRGLDCVAATPFVGKCMHNGKESPFYVSCMLGQPIGEMSSVGLEYDLLIYTNKHSLKNNEILIRLLPKLMERGYSCAVIDPQHVLSGVAATFTHVHQISHDQVLSLINKSRAALVLSLEGAGLFAQEAALEGRTVFCFPDTGASALPGAVEIARRHEAADIETIIDVIGKHIDQSPNPVFSKQMTQKIADAKRFFDFDGHV
jgi:hypothetical protein